MDSVINDQYFTTYSKQFTEAVTKKYFSEQKTISGEEILHLTPLKQINLLIIKKLMDKWKAEIDKLKSPYFNYEDQEVQIALNELMNILSRNIMINKKDFVPLFEEAVLDTLYLIFSPYDFFFNELGKTSGNHTQDSLDESKKFIKINAGLYSAFLEKIKSDDQDTFSGNDARKLFNKVCEEINFDPDDPDPYIDKLNEIEPIYLQKIYREYDPQDNPDDSDTDSQIKDEDLRKSQTIQDQFDKPKNTLADDLSQNPSNTILDYHQKQKIDSIRRNISIHQKFMFVKELFQNDENEFYQVIEFLDGVSEREDALEYLENNYFDPGIWNDEDEAVIEFMTVIDKKFI